MTESTWELLTNPADPRHGTTNGYSNHGCRCQRCRAANAAYTEEARRRREQDIPDEVHGTENGYTNYRCRCQPCRDAHADEARNRRT